MNKKLITAALALLFALVAPTAAGATQLVAYATGDIACTPGFTTTATACQHQAVAAMIPTSGVAAVLALGDNQYDNGTFAEYTGTNTFGATYAPYNSILHPTPGNHEWVTANAQGYKDYFSQPSVGVTWSYNGSATWYSFNVGQWHIVSLDSQCGSIGGCGTGSPEYAWLKSDLQTYNRVWDPIAQTGQPCLLAMWHKPRWSSGANGSTTALDPFWKLLANGPGGTGGGGVGTLGNWTADLVLNGHDHDYERFARMDGNGAAAAGGIREIVAGAGGEDFGVFNPPIANSEEHVDHQFGILKLNLNTTAYIAQFKSLDGLHDGTAANFTCHV